MKTLFILIFSLYPELILAKDIYGWKCTRTEVYEECYNTYTNSWYNKNTYDIDVLDVSINQKEKRVSISLRSIINPYIIYRQNFDYFKISDNGRKEKIEKQIFDTESVGYIVERGKTMKLSFDLCSDKIINSCILRVEICTEEKRIYFLDIYLERITQHR